MFSGLIEQVGKVTQVQWRQQSMCLTIQTQLTDLKLGESIAVDGICLTVTQARTNGEFCCDVSPETARVTIIHQYQTGRQVNLERALRVGDRLGGHFVLGHVDGCATLQDRQLMEDCVALTFAIAHSCPWLIVKGSVCVNGVSLTINVLDDLRFTVMIVPHTLTQTNLAQLSVGDEVNIEYDYLAKIVQQQLTIPEGSSLDKSA
ncbi:MAG: riboflavin synthase [Legionellales bacterium]|nr:riboflavin synthase [Legionellales bacterium]